ncbi:hypothetical protein BLNAU_15836 [Blattamonas nauphoetae]|uniref:Uncharacterized protein n=1 Tax=Blattamonas nauphoetae TaxID=2049346 RepID=A0ABQ9XD98_9EUKA|nr:hypothetical protein BLNAU_15836 [Blattamonas nauphoetae]
METNKRGLKYSRGVLIGNWNEEKVLSDDIREEERNGTIMKVDGVKTRSSPFISVQDPSKQEVNTTSRQTYQGAQIPQAHRGRRENMLEESFAITARTVTRSAPQPHPRPDPTSKEYGHWYPPNDRPSPHKCPSTERTLKEQKRADESNKTEEELEAEIAALEEELQKPRQFSESCSIYNETKQIQTRSMGLGVMEPKTGFQKQSYFTMPIEQYNGTSWKDL